MTDIFQSPEVKQLYAEIEQLQGIIDRRLRENALEIYNVGTKIHKKQIEFHRSSKRLKAIFGGNRTGKTVSGAVEAITHALGDSRYRKLKPSSGWVVSLTGDVQKEVAQKEILRWLPKREIKNIIMRKGSKEDPENNLIDKIVLKNGCFIGFKTCEQGREAFQGASLGWVWFDEEPDEKSIYDECRMRVMDTQGDIWFTMTPLKGLCFDEKTEILTENGWSKWNDVKLGDKAVSFNMETESLEWDEILGVYCNKNYTGTMVSMVNSGFDALVTPDHRWPVYSTATSKPKIVLAKDLKAHHYFKSGAEFSGCPKEKTYPDEFCELAGWVVGDGSFLKGKRYVKLYQSLTRYPEKCERIRILLKGLNAQWKEKQYPYSGFSPNGIACHFTISGEYGNLLRECLPNKEPSMRFLAKLTKEQLWMLYDGIMKSDGHQNKNGDHFSQTKESVVSSFQMLCVLLGLKSTVKPQDSKRCKNGKVYQTHIQRSERFSPNAHYASMKVNEIDFSGLIWCAQTNNTTLVAKRNGTVYITGNTWVYDLIYVNEKNNPEIAYWMFEWDDNPHLSEEEKKQLGLEYTDEELENRKYGNFTSMAGFAFKELRQDIHVRPIEAVPTWYKRYVSLDYGFDSLAVLWFWVDNYGHARCYRALRKKNLIISEAAKEILKFTGNERVDAFYAPPDLWNRRQDTGKSAAMIFYENGITLLKASNNREQGWLNVHEWLRPYEKRDEQTGKTYKTANMTFDEGLDPDLWKHLTTIQKDSKNPNDVAVTPHEITHYPDSLRAFAVSRMVASDKPTGERHYNFDFERPQSDSGYFGTVDKTYVNYSG